MAWTVTIYKDSGSLAISANVRFDLSAKKNVNDNGDVFSYDIDVAVEGVLVDSTPATIGANMVTYSELVTSDVLTQRVVIAQDGTTRWDLQPADGFVGPYVTDFQSRKSEEGGTGKSQWHYSFSVFYRGKGATSGGGETLSELHTSVAVTEKNGKVVRKVWKAEARGTSSSSALSAVKSFKPSEKYITSEVEEFHHDNRASGVWIWDATISDKKIKLWTCRVTKTGGYGYISRGTPGKDSAPVLYKKQNGKIVYVVEGSIISQDQSISAPGEHFEESDTLVRVPDEERRQRGAEIFGDPRNGEYKLDYHEVWYSTVGGQTPNHENAHNIISIGNAPTTGAVAQ